MRRPRRGGGAGPGRPCRRLRGRVRVPPVTSVCVRAPAPAGDGLRELPGQRRGWKRALPTGVRAGGSAGEAARCSFSLSDRLYLSSALFLSVIPPLSTNHGNKTGAARATAISKRRREKVPLFALLQTKRRGLRTLCGEVCSTTPVNKVNVIFSVSAAYRGEPIHCSRF